MRNLAVRIAEQSNPAHTSEPAKHLRDHPSHSFTWRVLSAAQTFHKRRIVEGLIDSVSIDNEYDHENEILPLTIMRMRFAQNTCSTRSGNSFHDEISSKTRSARKEFLKGKVYLL